MPAGSRRCVRCCRTARRLRLPTLRLPPRRQAHWAPKPRRRYRPLTWCAPRRRRWISCGVSSGRMIIRCRRRRSRTSSSAAARTDQAIPMLRKKRRARVFTRAPALDSVHAKVRMAGVEPAMTDRQHDRQGAGRRVEISGLVNSRTVRRRDWKPAAMPPPPRCRPRPASGRSCPRRGRPARAS